MLVYVLAIAVALGSFAMYMAAFFYPEVYRKQDFIWSGIGLFYALVLWVCAGQIRGGLLLGQTASVALLGWLGWQTLRFRWELTPVSQRTVPQAGSFVVQLGKRVQKAGAMLAGALASRPTVTPPAPIATPAANPVVEPVAETSEPIVVGFPPANPDVRITEGVDITDVDWVEAPVAAEVAAVEATEIEETVEGWTEAEVDTALADLGGDVSEVTESNAEVDVPVADEPEVPVPAPKASTKASKKPTSSNPITTTKEILVSLKEAAVQLFRTLTGRKPKRPTIVIERPTPQVTETPASEEVIAADMADFDLEDLDFVAADEPVTEPIETAEETAQAEEISEAVVAEAIAATETLESEIEPDVDLAGMVEKTDLSQAALETTFEPGISESSLDESEVLLDVNVDGVELNEAPPELTLEEPIVEPIEEPTAEKEDLVATDLTVVDVDEETNWDSDAEDADVILTIEPEAKESTVPYETEEPELVRPHPPSPELVEAALEDAAEKHIPAHPPATDDLPH